MDVVKDFEFAGRGHGKYSALYDEFLALPKDTVAKFSKGDDFEAEAAAFAISLRTSLYNRGYRTKIKVDGDSVYAKVVGRKKGADNNVADTAVAETTEG